MIDKKLGDLDDEIFVGNSRLEKLLKHEITPQIQKEVFELLKDSRLFLPVMNLTHNFNNYLIISMIILLI